jgi:hypothetical protein
MSAAFGPWDPRTSVTEFLHQTVGQTYSNKPDKMALIPKIADALQDEYLNDVGDLQAPTCSRLTLEAAFTTACGEVGAGMLTFCLKHLGVDGAVWATPDVQPHAPAGDTRLTADSAAVGEVKLEFGVVGKGGADNTYNYADAMRPKGSRPGWKGLTTERLELLRRVVAENFSKPRLAGSEAITQFIINPTLLWLVHDLGISPNICHTR